MAPCTELQLKTFQLSSMHSNSVLSVDSIAFISDTPSEYSPDELCRLVQEHQIWLVSSGICRLQIIVDQRRLPVPPKEAQTSFLQRLAGVICECPLWATLGLLIKREDIHHQLLYDGAPTLSFIMEHPNKSSMLLSPPHVPTARFSGIECFFCFNPDSPNTSYSNPKRFASNNEHHSTIDSHPRIIVKQRDDIKNLAQVALHILVGVKKRYHGVRVSLLDTGPSLLELAPAIWNAHYLKTVATHAANFSVVATILAASSRYQSSSLREKAAKLLHDLDVPNDSSLVSTEVELGVYRSTAERKLWGLVQTTLEPSIHTKKTKQLARPQPDDSPIEPLQSASDEMRASSNSDDGVPHTAPDNIDMSGAGFNHDLEPQWLQQFYELQLSSFSTSLEEVDDSTVIQELVCEFNRVMDINDTRASMRTLIPSSPEAAILEEQWNTILTNYVDEESRGGYGLLENEQVHEL
ncbi:hypothetical protein GGR53DRAFT_9900 [Hypoxylon sp. FL1150]|nr:hypothetical protein GGR53DRAFT_9900 [Hypoxylon sp. FL1150]